MILFLLNYNERKTTYEISKHKGFSFRKSQSPTPSYIVHFVTFVFFVVQSRFPETTKSTENTKIFIEFVVKCRKVLNNAVYSNGNPAVPHSSPGG